VKWGAVGLTVLKGMQRVEFTPESRYQGRMLLYQGEETSSDPETIWQGFKNQPENKT